MITTNPKAMEENIKKDWRVYKSKKKWKSDGCPRKSFFKLQTPFNIVCKKCGGKSFIYKEFDFLYYVQNIIVCSECNKKYHLHGIDG
jgi:DNA-directed RNA polymerase subunit RPC12/RpoP